MFGAHLGLERTVLRLMGCALRTVLYLMADAEQGHHKRSAKFQGWHCVSCWAGGLGDRRHLILECHAMLLVRL